jgi:hypothetical protein
MIGVKPERTGWRDAALSARHRLWGPGLGLVNIDSLWLEYDSQQAMPRALALMEYKHERAAWCRIDSKSNRTVADLADRAQLPFFVVTYSGDFSRFRVVPFGVCATRMLSSPVDLSELDWVEFLYRLRGRSMPESLRQELEQRLRHADSGILAHIR